jgi:hypothetical protein
MAENGSGEMMYPDYGLFLRSSRLVNPETRMHYYGLPVDHLLCMSFDTFCTTKNITHAGSEYAVTFDFSRIMVEGLVGLAPPESQAVIRSQVLGQREFPTEVGLPVPFKISITARLGDLQH